MTSKSLKRRKTITHKKVRNHKKTIRGGKGEGRKFTQFDKTDDESKDPPGQNIDLTKAEPIAFAALVAACIAVIIKVI